MGQNVRNVSYNQGSKILSFSGFLGRSYRLCFDDATDALYQGGNAPALNAAVVALDPITGAGTFDTTSLAFGGGSVHSVRFVDPANGHVTLRFSFTV